MTKFNRILSFLFAISSSTASYAQPATLSPTDINHMVNFLVADADKTSGLAYKATAENLNGLMLPLSYYSTADYWAKYVCATAGNNCQVEDKMGIEPGNQWSIGPDTTKPGADLQYERINVFNGVNIYDAATWQIAIALAAKNNIPVASFALANNENALLFYGYDGNAANVVADANRGNTSNFIYNGIQGKNISPQNAYFYRMVTRNWLSSDPFMLNANYLKKYISIDPSTPLPPDYAPGNVSWADWKPITGENAWAFLIGPLQTAFLEYGSADKIPLNSRAVVNAANVLSSLKEMQSSIGAVYYGPAGMYGNQGGVINPYEVSTENNASLLAGLLMLQAVLTAHGQPDAIIQTMIYGDGGKTTAGMLSYFKNNAWNEKAKTFYQGGFANQPGKAAWVPTTEPQAVDVNTWTVTVLGQPLIDSWFGAGTANTIWQRVKAWGGFYGPDDTLWGVGYSDKDDNGGGKFNANGILSTEWSAGAINMLQTLMTQYGPSSPYYTNLKNDFDSMINHEMSLRTDQYLNHAQAFPHGITKDFNSLVPMANNQLGFLYASKRYLIPFGWLANPLPSTCSTAWILMQYFHFNPFTLGGSFTPNFTVKQLHV